MKDDQIIYDRLKRARAALLGDGALRECDLPVIIDRAIGILCERDDDDLDQNPKVEIPKKLVWPDDAPDFANFAIYINDEPPMLRQSMPKNREKLLEETTTEIVVTRPNYQEGRGYQTAIQFLLKFQGKKIRFTRYEEGLWIIPNELSSNSIFEGTREDGKVSSSGIFLEVDGEWQLFQEPEKKKTHWEYQDYRKAMPISHLIRKEDGKAKFFSFSKSAVFIGTNLSPCTYESVAKDFTLPDGTELYKDVE